MAPYDPMRPPPRLTPDGRRIEAPLRKYDPMSAPPTATPVGSGSGQEAPSGPDPVRAPGRLDDTSRGTLGRLGDAFRGLFRHGDEEASDD